MPLRSSIFWSYFGQAVSLLASLASSVVLAHILTPHELGVFAIAFAVSAFLQALGPLGIAAYVIREKSLTDEVVASASTVNGIASVLFAVCLFILSWVPELVLGDASAGVVLRVLSLLPLLNALSFRSTAILQREMRFKRIAAVAAFSACFGAGASIALALVGYSYMSPAYGTIVATAFSSVAYNIAVPHRPSKRFSLAQWKAITWFGFRITSISGVAVVASRTNEILIGRLLGLGPLGLYTRATGLANPIWDSIYGASTRVLYARMSEDVRTTGDLHQTFLRGLENITAVMWPFLMGLAVLSGPVIRIVYGPVWLPAAAPLSLLLISQLITMCFGMNWELFVIRDEVGKQTRIEFIRSAVWIAACLFGCAFGINGAAAASVVAAVLGLLMYLPHVRRLSGIAPGALWSIYRRSGLLTIAAVLPSLLLMMLTGWSSETPLPIILMAAGLGLAIWCVALRQMDHPLWTEVRLLLAARRSASLPSETVP
jgi:O-antigen/teichoic acid export membrane protein